jgi:hypothetical protein
VKTKQVSPDNTAAATQRPAPANQQGSPLCPRRTPPPESHIEDMTTFDTIEFTTGYFSRGPNRDNLNYAACDTAPTARERFLAQHGPAAELPRRQVTSREVRKALLAAEMARWECF